MNWKLLHRLGTGCGIEIRGEQLRVAAAKSRPSGVSVLDTLRIENFHSRPPQEWGAEYAAFLKAQGLSHVSATVALPREEVIVRQLLLPPVSRKELAAAVRYQLDALHPFGEDEVYHAFAPLRPAGEGKGQLPVVVAIAEKTRVDAYANLFEAAGVAVAAFTVTDGALAAALRVRWDAPPRPFVCMLFRNGVVDVYGEAEERPLWTAQFDVDAVPPAKALQLTAAELRLDPTRPAALMVCGESEGESTADGEEPESDGDIEPRRSPAEKLTAEVPAAFELRSPAEMFPVPVQSPSGFDLGRDAAVFAVALESACPRLGWQANLLPLERRKSDSRWMYAPAAALTLALLLLGVAFVVRPLVQDRGYLAALETEAARLEQIVQNVEQAEQQSGHIRRRLARLQNVRQRSENDLRVLRELSEIIPNDVWLHNLEINDNGAQLAGEGPAAAPLLAVLEGSVTLTDASFSTSLTKTESGERFQIGARRRPADGSPRPAAAEPAQAAAPQPIPPQPVPPPNQQDQTLGVAGGEGTPAGENN
jgi:Tfp pilus assembly protein PilN